MVLLFRFVALAVALVVAPLVYWPLNCSLLMKLPLFVVPTVGWVWQLQQQRWWRISGSGSHRHASAELDARGGQRWRCREWTGNSVRQYQNVGRRTEIWICTWIWYGAAVRLGQHTRRHSSDTGGGCGGSWSRRHQRRWWW